MSMPSLSIPLSIDLIFVLLIVSGSCAFRLPAPIQRLASSRVAAWQGGDAADFDYSSKIGWDQYYQQDEIPKTEWHSSVPLETIAELVPSTSKRCVLVGCGTSDLPQMVQRARPKTQITLLDSSATCIDELKRRFGDEFDYCCGDATRMASLLENSYDSILDKGLLDTLLCGDGWNTLVDALLKDSSKVLTNAGGQYILVSYSMPTATRDFLVTQGELHGLRWQFGVKGSNSRVSLSIASCRKVEQKCEGK